MDFYGARIVEATHTFQGAEMMVEGTVLLHQHDDVFDIADTSRAIVRCNAECSGDIRIQ